QNSVDPQNGNRYGGAVVVGVWRDNAGTTAPTSGATIALSNSAAGTVVYVEPDAMVAAGTGKLAPIPNGTATGPSGLAMVYSSSLQDMTVTAGSTTKHVRVGAQPTLASAMLVKMN